MSETNVTPVSLRNRRVLVWGAMGFLGQHLVARLLTAGAEVAVLCRPRRRYTPPDWSGLVKWFELDGDAGRAEVMKSAIEAAEIVYDFAGSSGAVASNLAPAESLDQNCAEHLRFLQACEAAGTRPHIVFASSWLVYGESSGLPVNETHALAPRSLYGAHKACIEHYLEIYEYRGKITYTICRISNPYGPDPSRPRKTYKILNMFIEQALAGKPVCLFGDGHQLRDFIYIENAVDALIACGAHPAARNQIFNISFGKSYSMYDAAEMVRQAAKAPPTIFAPWPPEYLAAESGSYIADVSKARRVLGLNFGIDLREGLELTVQAHANQPSRI